MRKFFNKLWAVGLLCLTPVSFNLQSAIASTEVHQTDKKITVLNESTDSMANVLGILAHHGVNLHETAFFFDFDETIATKVSQWVGKTYHLLASPDLYRTYGPVFKEAKEQLGLTEHSDARLLNPTDTLGWAAHYEVLDDAIIPLITSLKFGGAHVGVCSALKATYDKLEMLRKVGIAPEDYTFASGGKAKTIEQYLLHNLVDKKISTIVLIDNSVKFALAGYSSTMGELAKTLPQTKEVPEIKIIAIEFTKFNKMATVPAMKAELENMMEALNPKPNPLAMTTEIPHEEHNLSSSGEYPLSHSGEHGH
ncbi:hypothetical protein [Candidatus Nucleicultrix amoebiphila]|uniref:DUF2608 domain-containing protein n=1 Tax=Candidatus Nucleicultrix amoebiphila FS5 TaxID=1414854 RepID=A0A1W6N3Q3_9PROT|nr:hypothetical protein [Candidatus Nucleicultrix amoebiphila]ARN84409.1 hypothetical protein GQ61_02695 [Candidatus Nucleicultrix amoebiphila FS5]